MVSAATFPLTHHCMPAAADMGVAAAQFVNSAVSATTSSYTSQCMQDFVPAAADLVLVEFSVNDWEVVDASSFSWMDNSLRCHLLLA